MSKIENLLHDARSHRAVPESEMVKRVSQKALGQWRSEIAPLSKASTAATVGSAPLGHWIRRSRRFWTTAAVLIMAGAVLPQILWSSPRLDMHLKYWLYDLADGLGTSMVENPLATALNLAVASALFGYALSDALRHRLSRL